MMADDDDHDEEEEDDEAIRRRWPLLSFSFMARIDSKARPFVGRRHPIEMLFHDFPSTTAAATTSAVVAPHSMPLFTFKLDFYRLSVRQRKTNFWVFPSTTFLAHTHSHTQTHLYARAISIKIHHNNVVVVVFKAKQLCLQVISQEVKK